MNKIIICILGWILPDMFTLTWTIWKHVKLLNKDIRYHLLFSLLNSYVIVIVINLKNKNLERFHEHTSLFSFSGKLWLESLTKVVDISGPGSPWKLTLSVMTPTKQQVKISFPCYGFCHPCLCNNSVFYHQRTSSTNFDLNTG